MFDQLVATIKQVVSLNSKELAQIENAFSFRKIPKKHRLAKEGEIATELYFLNKGILRLLYNNDGDEITAFIFSENLFASSYDSFLQQKPSVQILEALEDCELLVLNRESLYELYEKVPKMNILARIVAEQRFINAQNILSSYILKNPEQRYLDFAKANPEILQRVPQHIIASFLGITPVSLSRIRNRIHKL